MSKIGGSGKVLSYSDSQRQENSPPIPRHRFQKSGNKEVYETKNTENAFVMRVDMAGCSASSFVYKAEEDKKVHFSAHEPNMPEYGHDGRKYEGTVVCNPMVFEVKEAKAELVDGVMWLTIPKIPRTEERRIMSLKRC
ncbi:Alpha crystallin/Hsp20 domain-containing protein [Hirschfeldia incana]|nr:Alpha crystallin/Hsp20 domain-containing protein [Hirschfeldia incana]